MLVNRSKQFILALSSAVLCAGHLYAQVPTEANAQPQAQEAGRQFDAGPSTEQLGLIRTQGTDAARSKYPVVLHHGLLGYDRILGVDYFFGIPRYLADRGYSVFVTRVSAANSIAYRAAELAKQIDQVLAETRAAKVNIIAHSMGGLDARYLIATMGYGDRVASLSMIATPNLGSTLADIAASVDDLRRAVMRDFFEAITGVSFRVYWSGPEQLDLGAAIRDLTTESARVFNQNNRNDERVLYQSWAGLTSHTGLVIHDIVEPILSPGYDVLKLTEGENDGLVSLASAKWGRFRGYVPADHINLIGHPLGITSWWFDHRDFYEGICEELRQRGL